MGVNPASPCASITLKVQVSMVESPGPSRTLGPVALNFFP